MFRQAKSFPEATLSARLFPNVFEHPLKMQIIFYSYIEEERYHQKLFLNIWELKWKVPTDFLGYYTT